MEIHCSRMQFEFELSRVACFGELQSFLGAQKFFVFFVFFSGLGYG